MEDYTIYSKGIWERMLEKYPDLKEAAKECKVEDNPEKAKEIRNKYKGFSNLSKLTDSEKILGRALTSIEFGEQGFLHQLVLTGRFHNLNGASEYANASFKLVLMDFEESFQDWYKEIRKRNIQENASFKEYYEVFLEIIKLKLEYKVPYTKLFIRRLLENSSMPKEDSLEIKQYLLEEFPEMLPEIETELIE